MYTIYLYDLLRFTVLDSNKIRCISRVQLKKAEKNTDRIGEPKSDSTAEIPVVASAGAIPDVKNSIQQLPTADVIEIVD